MDIEIIATGAPGSIVLIKPVSDAGKDWIADNVDPEAMWWAGAVAVEGNYAAPIIEGAINDGLIVG